MQQSQVFGGNVARWLYLGLLDIIETEHFVPLPSTRWHPRVSFFLSLSCVLSPSDVGQIANLCQSELRVPLWNYRDNLPFRTFNFGVFCCVGVSCGENTRFQEILSAGDHPHD